MLPAHPEVAPGEEDAEGVPDDVVGPALLLHLSHPRVNEGKASVARLKSLQMFLIVKPGNVDTDWVPLHLSVERVVGRHGVEEFPPDELRYDGGVGARGTLAIHLGPSVQDFPVEFPHTQTAKLEVGREGLERVENVLLDFVWEDQAAEERLSLQPDPLLQMPERHPLPASVDLGLVALLLNPQHGRSREARKDCEGLQDSGVRFELDKFYLPEVNVSQRPSGGTH